MDNRFLAFIDILIVDTMQAPAFLMLHEAQKQELAVKLQEHFYNITFDTFIDFLPAEKLQALQNIPIDSIEMEQTLESFTYQMPSLLPNLEEKLVLEAEKIKQNPYVITPH